MRGAHSKAPWFDDWLPDHPVRWCAAFAGLYAAFFMLNVLLSSLLDILPDRISLIFFPAFIRVVALVVAGVAGAAGIVIGSMAIQVAYLQAALGPALLLSLASGMGALAAYGVMRLALGTRKLPITLPVLLALSGLYSALNAMLHGLIWQLAGIGEGIAIRELSLMMLGDFLGVIVMSAATRSLLRSWRVSTV